MSRRSGSYRKELRDRAVRMVAEVRSEHASEWAAIESVASKLGIGGGAADEDPWPAGGPPREGEAHHDPGPGRDQGAGPGETRLLSVGAEQVVGKIGRASCRERV